MSSKEIACDILGLPNHSSINAAVIRYKHLGLKWYPDLHDNCETSIEEFKNITEAFVFLVYGDKPLGRQMTLNEMFSFFQNIIFGNSSLFDNDEDDDGEIESCDDDDDDYDDYIYDSDYEDALLDDTKMCTAEMKSQALQNAQELILEEEREKKKAERRRAKKKRRKERKRQEKAAEKNVQQKKHPATSLNERETNNSKESDTSESEESIDTSSGFVAVIAKKKRHIPICKPKQKEEKRHPEIVFEPKQIATDENSRILRSRQLAIRGNEMANLGQFMQATDLFSESIKLDPSDHRFYGNRSYCFDRLGQFDRALSDAERSISLSPQWAKGYYRKGRAYLGLKNYAQAEECFLQVLKLDSDCDDAIKELQIVKILQLMEMGYSKQQAESAILRYGSVHEALNALIGGPVPKATANDQVDVFMSDDESDSLFLPVSYKTVPSESYDIKMDPSNPEGHNSIWIGNVQPDVTENKLTVMFGKCGELISIKILPEKFCAFVNYKNKAAPGKAMKSYQGYELSGANLVIRFPNLPGQTPATSKAKVKAVPEVTQTLIGDECYFWRTTGCIYGNACRFKHVREHKGVDKKPWHLP